MAAPIVISILANASQANATLSKTSTLMGRVGRAGRIMGAGIGIGLLALGAAAVTSGKSLIRIEEINAQTKSAIKATGGAAQVSAKHIETLTGALEATTSTEAETIQKGANLLLTFKKVGNQAGKNNKIFDRGVKASVDLARSGFGTVESASGLMGKALNDPIKGVTALGRSGITFTKQQKEQIKTLVESGKTLDAQKIILKEVEGQVGGAGEAFRKTTAGKIEQFNHQLGTLGETITAALMPGLTKLMDFLLGTVVPGVSALVPKFMAGVAVVKSFVSGLSQGSGEASGSFTQFRETVSVVLENVKSIVSSAVSIVTSLWQRFGSDLTTYAVTSLQNLMTYLRGAFNVIAGLFKVVSALLRGDWRGVWDGIKQIVRGALQVVQAVVKQALNVVKTVFSIGGKAIVSIVSGAFSGLASAASAGVTALVTFVKSIPDKITGALSGAKTLLTDIGGYIIDGLVQGMKDSIHKVTDVVGNIAGKVKGGLKSALSVFSPSKYTRMLGQYVSEGLALGMLDGVNGIVSAVKQTGAKTKKELAKQTHEILKAVQAAGKARLQALKAQRAEYAAAVAGAARDYASLGNLQLGDNQTLTVSGIKQFLTDRLAAIQNFNSKLAALKAKGLSKDLYNQIVQMGVEQGNAYADALSTASPAALAQVNAIQSKISGASSALGKATSNAMYAAGIQSAQGYYDGLQSMLKKIEKQGVKIAKSLVKELKKALGIKSPSRVMRAIGKFSVQGLDQGLDTRDIQAKGQALSKALVKGYANPQLDAQFSAGFRASDQAAVTGQPVGDTYNITVQLEAGMTQEQMGKSYSDAIEAAKKIGLVKK